MPEIIDLVFAKISPKCSFCMTENERFGLVFAKTGSINSGTGLSKETWGKSFFRDSEKDSNRMDILKKYL